VAATDRCTTRYCYRYRNETNVLAPSNSKVRGLSAVDGDPVWEFQPDSPVWNFVPLFGTDDSVMFQDFEGGLYSLDLATGALKWKQDGKMGMYTQAAAAYDSDLNLAYSITETKLASRWCNPYTPPGILIWCNTVQDTPGRVMAVNASTGNPVWELEIPKPPAGASLGKLNSGGGQTQLVLGMGLNTLYTGKNGDLSKPTELWAIQAATGEVLWKRDGPTLWRPTAAGDKEGEDIRRAMGSREKCAPNSWSNPLIDSMGDIYIGSQIGALQRWGSPDNRAETVAVLSELDTHHAFQDMAMSMAPGMMVVATCSGFIVIQT